MRSRCPVHRDEVSGTFILTRYADVRGLVSDNSLWRDPMRAESAARLQRQLVDGTPPDQPRGETTSILLLDDPDHDRIRRPLAQAFYARVAKFRGEVERIVEETLEAIDPTRPFDLMSRFCIPIPIDVIASILGVDRSRLGEFRAWSEDVIQSLNPFRNEEQTAKMESASEALAAYFEEILAARKAQPKNDLISDMVRLQADGAPLSHIELMNNLNALLIGGNLTTTDLIGNAVRLFLLNPGELAKLAADPSLIAPAVEEALRFEPPVDITGRIASADIEVGGCPMKKSQSMIL
ncbi:MAG: hypothetical protein ACRED8_05220, partial [Caulobacteraceae bacterium]